MDNEYLEHYTSNKISPVRQKLDDLEKHFYIRKKLYQSLGLTPVNFKNRDIIEIGPGGGYNTIYTASLKPGFYQLVEANKVGIEDIIKNLKKFQLYDKNIQIKNMVIEKYQTNRIFDVAICEGMLPCVKNNKEILNIIDSFLGKDSILIITCSDEISIFFDMARRLLANILLQKERAYGFEDKIGILVKAFEPHLDTLRGFGRFKEDWCADNLLGKALYNTNLSLSDVLEHFIKKYTFYNISPNIISDETWFKDVPLDTEKYNQKRINKFYKIWHNLIHYQVFDDFVWTKEDTDCLRRICKKFILLSQKAENGYEKIIHKVILLLENLIRLLIKNKSAEIIVQSVKELKDILERDNISIQNIRNDFQYFNSAFGRGQQYISLVKE